MSNNGCNCGCESITALEGETGSDGTSTVLSTAVLSTTAAVHSLYTANRASSASNALDYDWNLITIPAVPASNIAIFDGVFQITASGAHDVTMTVINTLSGAPVSGISFVQNCETYDTINLRFQIGNVSENDVFALHLATSNPAVTATLKGGNFQIDIFG